MNITEIGKGIKNDPQSTSPLSPGEKGQLYYSEAGWVYHNGTSEKRIGVQNGSGEVAPVPGMAYRVVYLTNSVTSLVDPATTASHYQGVAYEIKADRTLTCTTSGLNYTLSGVPGFTVVPGDVIYSDATKSPFKVATVLTTTTGTLDRIPPTAFSATPVIVSQAVYTTDLMYDGSIAEATRLFDFGPPAISKVNATIEAANATDLIPDRSVPSVVQMAVSNAPYAASETNQLGAAVVPQGISTFQWQTNETLSNYVLNNSTRHTVTKLRLGVRKIGSPSGNLTVTVSEAFNNMPVASSLTSFSLSTSTITGVMAAYDLELTNQDGFRHFVLQPNTTYYITIQFSGTLSGINYLELDTTSTVAALPNGFSNELIRKTGTGFVTTSRNLSYLFLGYSTASFGLGARKSGMYVPVLLSNYSPTPNTVPNLLLDTNSSMALMFYATNVGGTGSVYLTKYDVSFGETSAVNCNSSGIFQNAYCMADSSALPVNCSNPYLFAGNTRVTLNWTIPDAILSGKATSVIRVRVNGFDYAKFVAGVTIASNYWKLIDKSTIEIAGDLTLSPYDIDVTMKYGGPDQTSRTQALLGALYNAIIVPGNKNSTHQSIASAQANGALISLGGNSTFGEQFESPNISVNNLKLRSYRNVTLYGNITISGNFNRIENLIVIGNITITGSQNYLFGVDCFGTITFSGASTKNWVRGSWANVIVDSGTDNQYEAL